MPKGLNSYRSEVLVKGVRESQAFINNLNLEQYREGYSDLLVFILPL
uniref:Uncharacterized protein n=1 Tax=Anguilla anguilla TaxID=7936 RepID=A0A0E9S6T1_ANGAN